MTDERKVCIVTGASGGIGSAVVKKFYGNGYAVGMLDINEDALKTVIEKENLDPARVRCHTLDVSVEQQVKDTIEGILDAVRHISDDGARSSNHEKTGKGQHCQLRLCLRNDRIYL